MCVALCGALLGFRLLPSDTINCFLRAATPRSTMHTSSTEITLDPGPTWNSAEMPPPTSTEDSVAIAPWLANPPTPPPKRSNFGFASVKVLNRPANSSNVFTRPRASESTLAESFHSASTGDSSQRTSNGSTTKGIFNSIKRSLSRPNLNKHSLDVPPGPPPTVAFSHDPLSTYSLYVPPSPSPPPSTRPRKSHKQKSNAALAPPSKDLHLGLDGASMERILNVPVEDIVHPSALEDGSYGSLTSTDTTSSPTLEDFGPDTGWTSRYSNDLPPPPRVPPAFTNPFPTSSTVSLVSRRKLIADTSRFPQTTALLPVAQELQKPRRLGSAESTAVNDDPASWKAPESWAVPKESDEPEAPDYTSSEEDEAPPTSRPHGALLSPQTKSKSHLEGKAPPPFRKGSRTKVNPPTPVSAVLIPQC
jgi:hypothetical protein